MFIKKIAVRLLFVGTLIATLLVATPGAAYASAPANPATCDFLHICGTVINHSSHDLYINGNKVSGGIFYTYILHSGQNSTMYLADTDMVGSPTTNLQVNAVVAGPWQYIQIHDWMYINCYDGTVNGSAGVVCYWP